jgi:hypothetical protein
MDRQKEAEWNEAKRRCRLTDEEVRMAKDLGFQPRSLIKSIPSRYYGRRRAVLSAATILDRKGNRA